ncbi:MAG: transcription antitermination factor NusB [candidate division KSB1 bacterium]|nr:transcription antitermination factor NusB [candidate division KSB1 bacterium]MDZ7377944.1 transcription antitermination factor NusB [candidate division KSB1 bacterium]MDZ7385764.1 transcription antitermination factor NusB [candidate division KSB1 bacterium]MDZ7391355.1 transcription antitermination factor NusB [candidate division KSB1 bacterium]MDZ7413843.1 transcription antitermination factor NusB [candidate division KSB1 bacterium]
MIHSRRAARELALRALYAAELSGRSAAEVLADPLVMVPADGPLLEFIRRLVALTLQHRPELDGYIAAKTTNWDFARLAVIDKLVLRMAVCEFLYFEDIPPKVTIDEAIEISRKYSTDKSDKFVNGILDAVLNELQSRDLVVKTGRGLLDQSSRQE